MKKIVLIILPLFLVMLNTANGQILRNIARSATNQARSSAEDRASEEVNKEVDKGVNRFLDNLIGVDSTKNSTSDGKQRQTENSEAKANRFLKNIGISTSDVTKKDVYKFNFQIVTLTESTDYDGTKEKPIEFTMNINDDNSDFMFETNTEGSKSTTIFDNENKCMLILTDGDGQKTGFATQFDPEAFAQGVNAIDQSDVAKTDNEKVEKEEAPECEMTKTGRSKTISGYKCNEFRCETDSEIEVAWITKEFSASKNNIFGQTPWGSDFSKSMLDGMIMQYETTSKLDKSSSTMTVKSIDSNKKNSFSTVDYQISSFSFSPN